MSTVAVLGMGLLGSAFAENLLTRGHEVRVWNRSASKCDPLVELGATAAPTPAEAVLGAERVHLVLRADDAVDAVVAALRPGLGPDVPVLDHSTNLPERVAERFVRLRAEGVRYLPTPVFMAPANAREATGLMLGAGAVDELEALRPALETMTGRLLIVGDAPDKAAALKLAGNGLLFVLTAGMGDLFAVAGARGVTPAEVLELFQTFTPSAGFMGRRLLKAGEGPASFELTMALKDAELMVETAGADRLTLLPAIAAAMRAAVEAGQGAEDFAIFARR